MEKLKKSCETNVKIGESVRSLKVPNWKYTRINSKVKGERVACRKEGLRREKQVVKLKGDPDVVFDLSYFKTGAKKKERTSNLQVTAELERLEKIEKKIQGLLVSTKMSISFPEIYNKGKMRENSKSEQKTYEELLENRQRRIKQIFSSRQIKYEPKSGRMQHKLRSISCELKNISKSWEKSLPSFIHNLPSIEKHSKLIH